MRNKNSTTVSVLVTNLIGRVAFQKRWVHDSSTGTFLVHLKFHFKIRVLATSSDNTANDAFQEYTFSLKILNSPDEDEKEEGMLILPGASLKENYKSMWATQLAGADDLLRNRFPLAEQK